MTALRFQTRGRHQTSPASLRGATRAKSMAVGNPTTDMVLELQSFYPKIAVSKMFLLAPAQSHDRIRERERERDLKSTSTAIHLFDAGDWITQLLPTPFGSLELRREREERERERGRERGMRE